MAIIETDLKMRSVGELFTELGTRLRIPRYQRRYSWTPHNASQLFDDVLTACEGQVGEDPKDDYVLGTVILYSPVDDPTRDPSELDIVDGQQRLLTLKLLRSELSGEGRQFEGDRHSPLTLVANKLAERVDTLRATDGDLLAAFSDYLDRNCTILSVVTDNEDEAFQFFDSQNYRGKSLRPHDLLKAYHLREMRSVPRDQQAAIVREWEEAGENNLDSLFSTVLVRILRWSRGKRSLGFSSDDIGMFKGLSGGSAGTPSDDYHRAAQSLLPGLHAWDGGEFEEATVRNRLRSRFQLDAPVLSGQHFFEMVAFMREEVGQLNAHFTSAEWTPTLEEFWHDDIQQNSRYRYCQELLICAALYYTNKFGQGADFLTVRRSLVEWAYAPRLIYRSVTWRSIDTYALGDNPNFTKVNNLNLFAHIRDATARTDLMFDDLRLRTPQEREGMADREARLIAVIEGDHEGRVAE